MAGLVAPPPSRELFSCQGARRSDRRWFGDEDSNLNEPGQSRLGCHYRSPIVVSLREPPGTRTLLLRLRVGSFATKACSSFVVGPAGRTRTDSSRLKRPVPVPSGASGRSRVRRAFSLLPVCHRAPPWNRTRPAPKGQCFTGTAASQRERPKRKKGRLFRRQPRLGSRIVRVFTEWLPPLWSRTLGNTRS